MERLRTNHSIETIDNAIKHLSIQLRADPVTRHYAVQLDQARKALDNLELAYSQAHEERLTATQEVWNYDRALNRAVMTLSLETLVLTQNNRKDPLFKKLFPMAPSKITTPVAVPKKLDFMRKILATLEDDKKLGPLSRHIETIGAALKDLEQALARRKELSKPEKQAQAERDRAKKEAVKAYNMMYPRLQILFEDDTPRVKSFFADLR